MEEGGTAVIQGIISALMLYAQQATHTVAIPFQLPDVRFVSQESLAARVCNDSRCDVRGWFSSADQVIYMAGNRNIMVNNMHARSILLHEIVHYIQHQIGFPQLGNICLTWKAREIEAYKIQYRWLYENHVRVRTPVFNLPLVNFDSIRC